MTDTLDTMVAFVLVIVGLSVSLQLLMDTLKEMLGLRWRTYRAFIEGFYREHMGAPGKASKSKAGRIESVTKRFRAYAGNVSRACEALRALRERVDALGKQLEEAPNAKEKASVIELNVGQVWPEAEHWIQRLRVLNLPSLLSIYRKLSLPERGEALFVKADERLAALGAAWSARGEDGVEQLEAALADAARWLGEVEREISAIQAHLEVHADGLLDRLRLSYQTHMKRWCMAVGLVFCLFLNADSIEIYKSLRHDPALQVELMSKEAVFAQRIVVEARAESVNELVERSRATSEVVADKEATSDAKREALMLLQQRLEELFGAFRDEMTARAASEGKLDHLDRLSTAINTKLSGAREDCANEKWDGAWRQLDEGLQLIVQLDLALAADRVRSRLGVLADSGLPLGWSASPFHGWGPWEVVKKFIGVLLTTMLISLGAPFWNDLLKALLGLRGTLAKGGETHGGGS